MSNSIEAQIDVLPTPEKLCAHLECAFTEDQAYFIAAQVDQPLLTLIKALNQKIELENRRNR